MLEVGAAFLPAIPAYLWLWPAVAGTPWQNPAQVATYLYFLGVSLWVGGRRWNWRDLGLSREGLGLGLACGLALTFGRVLVILALDLPQAPHLTLSRVVSDTAFYLGLVGPVEELLFRGVIYRGLADWRSDGWAVVGSSLVFGVYHIGGQGALGALGTGLIGLVLGLMRWRAGGLVGLMVAHGLMDVTVLEMWPSLDLMALEQVVIRRPALMAAGYLLILAVPVYLWRLRRGGSPDRPARA